MSLYSEYRKQLKRFREGEGEEYFPVYYSKIPGDADDYFLSPASKTREVYRNQLKNMVKSFGSCESEDALCQSCYLFGTLRNEFTVASRIRFSDLQVQWEADSYEGLFEQVGTLRPLSSPKLNNMEFYMKRPDQAVFWTYDYYVDQYGNVHPFPEGSFPEISGRKFYWHQMGELTPYDSEKTSQNMTVRPVSPGVSFHGSLYFHKISLKELDQLIWLLNVGEKGDIEKREHGYKLGAAKPLGFGSIALAVDEVLIRKVCLEGGGIQYREDSYTGQEEFAALFHEALEENFSKMTNFDSMKGKNVSYPKTKDGNEEGYQWFVENHKARKKKGGYTDSPRKREQMLFMEYMIPMEPELAVAFDENHIPASDKSESTLVECPFQEGKPYEACVVHVPKNGKILHIEVEGRKGYIKLNSAKLAKSYSEGQKIQVKFVTVKAYTDGGIGYYFS